MMGIAVVVLTGVLLLAFSWQKIRQLKKGPEQHIYCLFSATEEQPETDNFSRYYGIFQVAEQEIRLEIPYQLFLQHQGPERGELIFQNDRFIAFKK